MFCFSLPFQPLIKASKYFSEQGIPFPQIVPGEEEAKSPKECYIVGDKEGPETPVVLLFPLVNDTFRNYKAPGKLAAANHFIKASMTSLSIHGIPTFYFIIINLNGWMPMKDFAFRLLTTVPGQLSAGL